MLRRRVLEGIVVAPALLSCRIRTMSTSTPSSSSLITQAPLRRVSLGPVSLAFRAFQGVGTPVVFVHGSLEDHNGWRALLSTLRASGVPAPLLTYDRRGHGASTVPPGQGVLREDVEDLVGVVQQLGTGRAHLVGHSYGATIVLEASRLAPEIVESAFLVEPPLFGLLRDRPQYAAALASAKAAIADAVAQLERGELDVGLETFIDRVAFGPGAWRTRMDAESRARMLANVDTWLDQARDPQRLQASPEGLAALGRRATLVTGTASLSTFSGIADALVESFAELQRVELTGAAHDAPATHPGALAEVLRAHLERNENR
ncbi:MAG: alpha/beta hydrolase [Myxococcota bacterium]